MPSHRKTDMSEHGSTAKSRTARCGCGNLTVTLRGEPSAVYGCSCLTCQRKTGSAFSYAAMATATDVTIAGAQTLWRHNADSGRWIESVFCPTCGVTVAFRCEAAPGLIGIPVGCFADPDFAQPGVFLWGSRRHRWLKLPDGVETLDEQ
jgi:hypothetical protein